MTYLYKPYTATPSTTDKNFINVNFNGYAHCIKRNSKGFTLPNCVAFAHGMWLKILTDAEGLDYARDIEAKMCRGNAEVYWKYNDGFERGQTPKLGAIMVWEGKGSLAGHVMTVTTIKDNGDVIATGSDYSGSKFYTRTYTKKSSYRINSNYTFRGFIYPPLEFAYTVGTPVERDTEENQVKIDITNLRARSYSSTNGKVMGYVNPGIYNVRATRQADGYTWYMIEQGMWCAEVKGVEYLPAHPVPHYDMVIHDIIEDQVRKISAAARAVGAENIEVTER